MTSVNIKYPEETAVKATIKKLGLTETETLSSFTQKAVQERINRLNGGVPDAI